MIVTNVVAIRPTGTGWHTEGRELNALWRTSRLYSLSETFKVLRSVEVRVVQNKSIVWLPMINRVSLRNMSSSRWYLVDAHVISSKGANDSSLTVFLPNPTIPRPIEENSNGQGTAERWSGSGKSLGGCPRALSSRDGVVDTIATSNTFYLLHQYK